jgi:hypothetical protein
MACITVPTALAIGAGVQGIGGLIQGFMGKSAAEEAGKIESTAALQAGGIQATGIENAGQMASQGILAGGNTAAGGYTQALQKGNQLFSGAASNFNPYLATGATGANMVSGLLGGPSVNPDQIMSTLESMPGYQFTLQQGLKATQNSYAAKGLGSSGAALRGAAEFTHGLATTNYNLLFTNAMQAMQQGQGAAESVAGLTTDWNAMQAQLETGRAGVLGGAQRESAGALASATAGASATRGAAVLGSGAALAAGKIGGQNAFGSGTNALFSGLGNAFTTTGLFNAGFYNGGNNPLMPKTNTSGGGW